MIFGSLICKCMGHKWGKPRGGIKVNADGSGGGQARHKVCKRCHAVQAVKTRRKAK